MKKPSAPLVLFAAVGGCTSLTEITVGPDDLAPIAVEAIVALPIGQATAGVRGAFTDPGDDTILWTIADDPMGIRMAASANLPFLSAEQSAQLGRRLGDKGGAVERIELQLLSGSTTDLRTGEALDDGAPVEVGIAGVTLGTHRVALDDATRDRLLRDIEAARPVTMPVELSIRCAPALLPSLPTVLDARYRAQPYLIIQALRAL